MGTVFEIEDAIKRLPPPELGELRRWFEDYVADQWDAQIEADARAGKLDFLLKKAEEAERGGNVRSFDP